MTISLENAMKIGGLRDCEIIAGHKGITKEIRNVTIMEVPDIIKWLKGKELMLTSLYPIKDNPDSQRDLVKNLYHAGTTALAIKPFRFVEEIPDMILEEADKYDFPIIQIPKKISYLDILSPVMNVIFDNKVVLQEDLEQASRILNEISLSDQGMGRFIETLSNITKNVVTIESELSYIDLPSPAIPLEPLTDDQKSELSIIRHPVRLDRQYQDEVVQCIVAPILLEDRVYGHITCWGIQADHLEIDLAIMEKASTLLSLEFLRSKVRHDVEQQYKNEFIRDLLFNESMQESDLFERGEKYNLSKDTDYICLLIKINHDSNRGLMDELNEIGHQIRHYNEGAIVGKIRDLICVFYPVGHEESSSDQLKSLINHLEVRFGKQLFEKIGIGRCLPGIRGLKKSFNQAEQAVKVGNSMKVNKIIHYDDLGVYRLLGQVSGDKELQDFFDETVGKILVFDENHDLELLSTLQTYFENDENLKETAKQLFIHVNTLKYRIKKIQSITGYSLSSSEGKLMLHLGLKINQLYGIYYR